MKAKTINFQGGTFKKDPLDLSGYNFPLPVSFTDCTFKGAVRIEAVEFESWVDFVGATFEKPVLLKDSTFDGQVDFESARFKESLAITFVLMGRVTACPSANRRKSGLLLSLNNTFPFLSWQKQSILASADACLFGSEGPTLAFAVSSVVQMCLALMSFFLLGLAVRNTFKMQT